MLNSIFQMTEAVTVVLEIAMETGRAEGLVVTREGLVVTGEGLVIGTGIAVVDLVITIEVLVTDVTELTEILGTGIVMVVDTAIAMATGTAAGIMDFLTVMEEEMVVEVGERNWFYI